LASFILSLEGDYPEEITADTISECLRDGMNVSVTEILEITEVEKKELMNVL